MFAISPGRAVTDRPTAEKMAGLSDLAGQWAVLLTTFRRDGTAVGTVVNLVVEGDRAFFRTYDRSGKARRLRQTSLVEVAPATWRGRRTGPSIRATARLLDGAESERAGRLIDAEHPWFQRLLVRLGHRLRRYRTLHYELRPAGGEGQAGA